MKYLSTLVKIMIASTFISLILFFRGVFIDRYYLTERADGKTQKMPPVVLLVIDSFRMDLALSQSFPFIYQKKQDEDKSILFLSLAETPSVTGPRIQTMTTGNFAPLTKVLDNFHDSEISEDNVIEQSKNNGKKTLFIGDNNWLGLYPNLFTFAYPLNKLRINTKKMYIVDLKFEEIFNQHFDGDFDLTIMHFLGLDFVAHEYSRVEENEVLDQQLKQLSSIIERIYKKISNETTLIITGDHGMLNDGNHGGNSTYETNTVFFACRKSGGFNRKFMENIGKNVTLNETVLVHQSRYLRTVKQIDIAPTLAKLIGVPIPFSNIGILIPELFSKEIVDGYCQENLEQMFKYVKTIKNKQGLFYHSQIQRWKQQLKKSENCKQALSTMEDIQYQSRIIWNNYNSTLIVLSLSFSILTFILFISTLASLKYVKNFSIEMQYCKQVLFVNISKYKAVIFGMCMAFIVSIYFVDIEIMIALLLNIILLPIVIYSLIYLNRSIKEQQQAYLQINIIDNSQTHKEQQYIKLFILIIFLHKIYRQGSLVFSLDSQTNEYDSLFDQLIDLLIMCFILNISIKIKGYYNSEQQEQRFFMLVKQIGTQLTFLILSIFLIKLEYFYLQLSNKKSFDKLEISKQILHLYIPCLIQHVLLFQYQKKTQKDIYNKIINHLSLLLLHSYFIIRQLSYYYSFSYNLKLYLKITIYFTIIFYLYSRDFISLLIPAQIATSQYGIALYTYSICLMILIYFLLKPQLKLNKIIFVSIIALYCQYFWFMIGNNCTISSVQNATQRIKLHPQNPLELALVILLMLTGPYICGFTILKYVGYQIQNEEIERDQNKENNVDLEIKLQFLLNFFIQILFTEFYNFNNLGGLTKIQFKYIFDVAGYFVICILLYIY